MNTSELQTQFYKETNTECVNSQGEFDIDYVEWLQNKVIASQFQVKGGVSDEEIEKFAEELLEDMYPKEDKNYDTLTRKIYLNGIIDGINKWMRDRMFSLLAEKEKRAKYWEDMWNIKCQSFEKLESELLEKEKEVIGLNMEVDIQKQKVKLNYNEILSLQSELEAVKEQLKNETGCVEHIKEVCDNYEKELEAVKRENEMFKIKYSDAKIEITLLQYENEKLDEELGQKIQAIEETAKDIQNIYAEWQELKSQAEKKETDLKQAKENEQYYINQANNGYIEISELSKTCKALQSELEAVKEENKTYLDCIERGNKQVQELKSQTEKLEKERDLLIKKGDFVIDNLIALRKDPKELDRVLREIEEYFNPTTN